MTDEPQPNAPSDKPSQPSDATRVERNKGASRRWIEVFNQRDDAAEADVRAPDFVAYAPASPEPAPLNPEAWTRFLSGFVAGFPDLRLTVEESLGEGDLVAQMIHFEGTHIDPSPDLDSVTSVRPLAVAGASGQIATWSTTRRYDAVPTHGACSAPFSQSAEARDLAPRPGHVSSSRSDCRRRSGGVNPSQISWHTTRERDLRPVPGDA